MVADDQGVLAVTGPLFDGRYEHRRRALLAVTGPLFDGRYEHRRRALLVGRDPA